MSAYMFVGTAIDGPRRGALIESNYPEYNVAAIGPLPPLKWSPHTGTVPPPTSHHRYRWSYSLGQWCLVY